MDNDVTYFEIFNDLKTKIISTRHQVIFSVNLQLLTMYWDIGNTIYIMEKGHKWGAKIVQKLSDDLRNIFPEMKGLSLRNLRYMRDFSLAYPDFKDENSILQQAAAILPDSKYVLHPAATIPWSHNQVILDKVKSAENRVFYLTKCAQNGWSRNILSIQIESELHLRQGMALTNFSKTLPPIQSDLARETFKNPYFLDFLNLSEDIRERDLELEILRHLKKFLLELGRGFAYVGNQFRLKVKDDDFSLDLLFYNFHLYCFVIFDLKMGDFRPEYAGKLNFYINAVNAQVKSNSDQPTIGVLLCNTPNETVVRYSIQNIQTPLGVAEYKLSTQLPESLKSGLPSMKELAKALRGCDGEKAMR